MPPRRARKTASETEVNNSESASNRSDVTKGSVVEEIANKTSSGDAEVAGTRSKIGVILDIGTELTYYKAGMKTREKNRVAHPGRPDEAKHRRTTAEVKADNARTEEAERVKAVKHTATQARIIELEAEMRRLQEMEAEEVDHPPSPPATTANGNSTGRELRARPVEQKENAEKYAGEDFGDSGHSLSIGADDKWVTDEERSLLEPSGLPAVDRCNRRLVESCARLRRERAERGEPDPQKESTDDEGDGGDGDEAAYVPDMDADEDIGQRDVYSESDDEISGLPSPSASAAKRKAEAQSKKVVAVNDDGKKSGGGGRKRAGSETVVRQSQTAKKAKTASGGLAKDWESRVEAPVIKPYIARTTTSSRASSPPASSVDARSQAGDTSDGDAFQMGGISDEEEKKSTAPLTSEHTTNVAALITAGAGADTVTIEHQATGGNRKQRKYNSDLPTALLQKWSDQVVPHIRARQAAIGGPWVRISANAVGSVLTQLFGDNHGFLITGVVFTNATNCCNNWRGAIARGGEKAVEAALAESKCVTTEQRRAEVQRLFGTARPAGDARLPFLFDKWDTSEAQRHSGFCRSFIILHCLAAHLHELEGDETISPLTLSIERPPVAGLTLCCISVYRALSECYSTGTYKKGKAMSEATWGNSANMPPGAVWAADLFESIRDLSGASWASILTKADTIRQTFRSKKKARAPEPAPQDPPPPQAGPSRQIIKIVDEPEDN